jgi:hypothetical protein
MHSLTKFWEYRRQTLPLDYFMFARHPGTTSKVAGG